MASEMIQSRNELIAALSFNMTAPAFKVRPLYVSTKIRKECMVDINQNCFAANGRVWKIQWTNHGGGVWEPKAVKLRGE
jgi:hypothetical protein